MVDVIDFTVPGRRFSGNSSCSRAVVAMARFYTTCKNEYDVTTSTAGLTRI